jgi:hypothetical protein
MLWNITPHKSYMMQQANKPKPTNHPTNQPPKKLHEAKTMSK